MEAFDNPPLVGLIIGVVIGGCMMVIRLVDYLIEKQKTRNAEQAGGQGQCKEACVFDKTTREKIVSVIDKVADLDLKQLVAQSDLMFRLHSKTDEDGVPVWYVRRSLEEAIKEMSLNVANQNQLIKDQTTFIKNQSELLRELLTALRAVRQLPPSA